MTRNEIEIPEITVTPSQFKRIGARMLKKLRGFIVQGASGIGKTAITYQMIRSLISDDTTVKVIYKTPAVEETIDWRGMAAKNERGGYDFAPIGEMNHIFDDGSEPIADIIVVVLDDFSQAPKSVQAGAMPFLLNNHDDTRFVHGQKIRDNVVFVACANRKVDKCGTNGVLEAVTGRIPHVFKLEVSAQDWISWALSDGVEVVVCAFIKFYQELLWTDEQNLDMQKHGNPRNWVELSQDVEMGWDAEDKLAVYAGAVGESCATQFIDFEAMFNELPDVDMICADPMNCHVPEDKPGAMWALCATIAKIADVDNFEALCQYTARFNDREFAVFATLASVKLHPELTSTRAFMSWAEDNREVMS